MKQITIRQSVRKEIADIIPGLVSDALVWMELKYPDVSFDTPEFIFSGSYNRSRYFRNAKADGKYIAPNVCISTRATLYLYPMASLGLSKKKLNKVFTGSTVQMMCALIHELTHHVQYEQSRSRGELETTANELEYLKEYHFNFYHKLKIKASH